MASTEGRPSGCWNRSPAWANDGPPYTPLMPSTPAMVTGPRLTVDRIPTSCHCSNVRSSVSEGRWDTLRRRVYRRAGSRCVICGDVGAGHPVEAHEAWEYDEAERMQRLAGMMALCPACHEAKHFDRAVRLGRGEQVRAHLARINGWSEDEVEEHLRTAAEDWRRRDEVGDWGLDLAALAEYGMVPPPPMDSVVRHATRGAVRLRARRDLQVARERAPAGATQPVRSGEAAS
jgi:5-methylcytosine-specific restriction endonuclease McrA